MLEGGRGSWGGLGGREGADPAGFGVPATTLLAAKPRGEDLPRRRAVYKHVGFLPHRNFFSVLNKICLPLELKAFYLEGKSSLKGPGRFSRKT